MADSEMNNEITTFSGNSTEVPITETVSFSYCIQESVVNQRRGGGWSSFLHLDLPLEELM